MPEMYELILIAVLVIVGLVNTCIQLKKWNAEVDEWYRTHLVQEAEVE